MTLGYIVAVLIFAAFCGVLLLGFYVYTKIQEKKFKKYCDKRVEEEKEYIKNNYNWR